MSLRRLLCSALVGGAFGVLVPLSGAQADHVACGQIIMQDTTLDGDVGPCDSAAAITIGAHDITLDLAGHTVSGSGIGIDVFEKRNVRIRNGSVTAAGAGINFMQVYESTIDDLDITESGAGIEVRASGDNVIRNSTIVRNGVGISLFSVVQWSIHANEVSDNHSAGILMFAAQRVTIEGNRISRNGSNGVDFGGGSLILGVTSQITVRGNSIAENGGHGVIGAGTFTRPVGHSTISSNSIARNRGDGIHLNGPAYANEVSNNYIVGNLGHGVLKKAISDRTGNRIINNLAMSNGVFDLADENPSCDGNVWAGNRFLTRNQPCVN